MASIFAANYKGRNLDNIDDYQLENGIRTLNLSVSYLNGISMLDHSHILVETEVLKAGKRTIFTRDGFLKKSAKRLIQFVLINVLKIHDPL